MSRICVKNLPKYVSQDRLREYFSQKGEITDVKLMLTREGKSRQFAFIGYRSEHEAQEALKHFDKSYLDTSRIHCELAHKVGDPNIPRPWSRHSSKIEDKSASSKNSSDVEKLVSSGFNGKGKKAKKTNETADPKLQEFLHVMQPRMKTKLWDDDAAETRPASKTEKKEANKVLSNKKPSTLDDGRAETLPVISTEQNKLNKVPSNKKSSSLIDCRATTNETGDEVTDDPALKTTKTLVYDETVSDMDYLKSRMKKEWSDSDSSDDEQPAPDSSLTENSGEDDMDEDDHEEPSEDVDEGRSGDLSGVSKLENSTQTSQDEKEDGEFDDDRLFVRNLPYTATEDELEEAFRKCGTVSQVHIPLDKQTKRSKGLAYILYAAPESAARALEELDKSIFQGRILHVLPAKQKTPKDKDGTNIMKNFKEKREEERKASEANGNTKAWNAFFMRTDTVVENIARKFGVSKSDLLDQETDDIAVRLALGETQVLAETKKALKNAGVNVAALDKIASGESDAVKRSNHVILVKNLPYGSSEAELAKMFRKFGSLDKIVLPPTKTIALVVFLEPSEARAAFKGLSYKRYKDGPIYLEWAPADILDGIVGPNDEEKDSEIVGEQDAKKQLIEDEISFADIDPDRLESQSLYIKNLNFKTTDESLREHFAGHVKEGKILSVKIKKNVKNGKNVSAGFGFIQFDSVETATYTCKNLQGTVLDGHALILQLCHAKKDEKAAGKTEKDKSSTKIIVRNVAFEATQKDLRQLFSPFGQIKRLRLPKKFENHRGFAFVEFLTKQEAQNALEALSSTHLYGRRLVLERAKEGESLEELRERTAAQFTNEQDGFQTKLSKKRKHIDIVDEDDMKFD